MPTIDINNVDSIGVVRDAPPYMLPPEAWSFAENVRCRNGAIEKLLGWEQIFGTPGVAPDFALPLSTQSGTFWLYVSLTKGYLYDGSQHYNITRPSGSGFAAVAGATGTSIGDLTGGGNLAAAFDGTTAQALAACASKAAATTAYIGKNYTAQSGKIVYKVEVCGSNDQGYVNGANPSVTITLRGSATLPSDFSADGTVLGSTTFTDTADESAARTINSNDRTTAWNYLWIYVSQAGAAATMDVAELTVYERSDTNYTASVTRNWNGTIIGGIPILNNNNDVPQYWAGGTSLTNLANLTNWDANRRALVIRALGPYLIAFNLTISGTNYPHRILWSHPADPGSVPSSWDETDATVDAGISELPDVDSGIILDALPLGGNMYIYKETATWKMTPTGGRFIFDIKSVFETTGILAQRCVAVSPDGRYHVVATQDDIIKHDGVQVTSLLDQKMRKTLFDALDTTNYNNSFMFTNPNYNEVWFCYPSAGATNPDRAIIINMRSGQTEASGITFRNAAVGQVLTADAGTWDAATGAWDTDPDAWSTLLRRRVVVCGTDATKFYKLDSTSTRDGSSFTSTLQRVGLSVIGRTRQGAWIVDHEIRKFFKRVWPKLRGGPVSVRIGFQSLVDGAVTWNDAVTFDPSSSTSPADGVTVDSVGSGRAISLEISDSSDNPWYLDGYKVDVTDGGKF